MTERAMDYILGLGTGDTAAFEAEMRADPALADEVRKLRLSFAAVAASAAPVAPPPELRAHLLAGFKKNVGAAASTGAPPAAPPLRERPLRERPSGWPPRLAIGFAAAAAVAGLMAVHFARRADDLAAQVAQLKRANDFKSARIAVMGSLLKNQPNAVGVSVWKDSEQHGLLVVENFPSLPADQDYQLWVIDEQNPAPVSAGTFRVDDQGKVRIEFQPSQKVGRAQKFAITVEPSGGSTTPHLDQMVVIGQ